MSALHFCWVNVNQSPRSAGLQLACCWLLACCGPLAWARWRAGQCQSQRHQSVPKVFPSPPAPAPPSPPLPPDPALCRRKIRRRGGPPPQSMSIWRRKKEMGKEGLMAVAQLKRLAALPPAGGHPRLEQFMRSHVSRLLRTDLLAVQAELLRQDHVILSMKVTLPTH